MKHTEENCAECGGKFKIPTKEWKRRTNKGITRFFCSLSHSAIYFNRSRQKPVVKIIKKCEYCGANFEIELGGHESRFCCRSHASFGSVTEARRAASRLSGKIYGQINKINFIGMLPKAMKKREAFKYELLKQFLESEGIIHEFEFGIGSRSFDLCVPSKMLLIEFDGAEHRSEKGLADDAKKDRLATSKGFKVIHLAIEGKVRQYAPELIHFLR
jgi:very-short-patch-repair endonuclease